jgi:hypothetical protein
MSARNEGLLASLRVSLRRKAPPTPALIRQIIAELEMCARGQCICIKCGIRQEPPAPDDILF